MELGITPHIEAYLQSLVLNKTLEAISFEYRRGIEERDNVERRERAVEEFIERGQDEPKRGRVEGVQHPTAIVPVLRADFVEEESSRDAEMIVMKGRPLIEEGDILLAEVKASRKLPADEDVVLKRMKLTTQ